MFSILIRQPINCSDLTKERKESRINFPRDGRNSQDLSTRHFPQNITIIDGENVQKQKYRNCDMHSREALQYVQIVTPNCFEDLYRINTRKRGTPSKNGNNLYARDRVTERLNRLLRGQKTSYLLVIDEQKEMEVEKSLRQIVTSLRNAFERRYAITNGILGRDLRWLVIT